ncbi:MAG: RNA polymerase sigma factor [Actinomycetota bacterium]|nr:RNA polymerase sigma factor [Actinomycetota bacterium]
MDVPNSVIEACKAGDPRAFEELVKLTHKDVYSLAYRLVGNPDDAAEVAQETYMKLLRSIRQYRGDSKFSTWLYRVTSSVAITGLRKRSRQRLDVALDEGQWDMIPADPSADPAQRFEREALKDRLDGCLRALPVGYRSVVVLKDIYGFSLAEIGKQLGISEGAAKVRLFRARQRLKEMLYEDGPVDYEDRKESGDAMS